MNLRVLLQSNLGPEHWTLENWIGVGIYAGAFLVLLRIVLALADPGDRRDGRGGGGDDGR